MAVYIYKWTISYVSKCVRVHLVLYNTKKKKSNHTYVDRVTYIYILPNTGGIPIYMYRYIYI